MRRSSKLQRLTSMSVPALLAANAMVLVLGLAGMTSDSAGAETVTYIKAADGTVQVVDPSTPEGSRAIAAAEERGDDVVTVPEGEAPAVVEQQQAPATTLLPGVTIPNVGEIIDDTKVTIVDTVDQVGNTVDSVVDGVTDIVDDTAGTDIGETVDPAVDDLTDTLTTTVSTVLDAVPSDPADVITTTTRPTTTTTQTVSIPTVTVPEEVPVVGGTPTPTVTVPPTTLPGL